MAPLAPCKQRSDSQQIASCPQNEEGYLDSVVWEIPVFNGPGEVKQAASSMIPCTISEGVLEVEYFLYHHPSKTCYHREQFELAFLNPLVESHLLMLLMCVVSETSHHRCSQVRNSSIDPSLLLACRENRTTLSVNE
jgi:hypothetical protein